MVHSLIASPSEFLFGTEHPEFILHTGYPQSNGQAEATNKTLITALKKRLDKPKENGWKSYPASCGLIEPHLDGRQETLPSPSIRYGRSHSYRNRVPTIRTEAANRMMQMQS
ncbi:hypothetical protein CK203_012805 [Vitis vinifera]|uniref:Integrase catalytic domain-containing protein n=1 Tax=Vitis vinifera TaxID=29760 RepID=A0A438JLK9_VITVI|nr:hypothetical protein CK203_012805 [Vitis vinifera]